MFAVNDLVKQLISLTPQAFGPGTCPSRIWWCNKEEFRETLKTIKKSLPLRALKPDDPIITDLKKLDDPDLLFDESTQNLIVIYIHDVGLIFIFIPHGYFESISAGGSFSNTVRRPGKCLGQCDGPNCVKKSPANKMSKCSACCATSYCSKECQKSDFPRHKFFCRIISGQHKRFT